MDAPVDNAMAELPDSDLDAAGRRAGKSAGAFRTISEVAGDLNVPQHVLRFWETRFTQIRPLKRAGGRRYYRPEDIDLLRRIRELLYNNGYTIKGVQRLLRDNGRRGDDDDPALADGEAEAEPTPPPQEAAPVAIPAAPRRGSRSPDIEGAISELTSIRDMLGKDRR